jgi:hypothetical protein
MIRFRSPRASATRATNGLTNTRVQSPAAITQPTSLASSRREASQSGQNGSQMPTVPKVAA